MINCKIIRMSPDNTNSVLFYNKTDAVIFDPWGTANDWKKLLDENKLNLKAIYCTHGHADHISAAPDLATEFNIHWELSKMDFCQLKFGADLLEYFGLPRVDFNNLIQPIDFLSDTIEIFPDIFAKIISTPGHTGGSVCFAINHTVKIGEQIIENILISGDTLFYDSIGRWDLPGGDPKEIRKSLIKLIEQNFPDNTLIIPGHGICGNWSIIKAENKFLRF